MPTMCRPFQSRYRSGSLKWPIQSRSIGSQPVSEGSDELLVLTQQGQRAQERSSAPWRPHTPLPSGRTSSTSRWWCGGQIRRCGRRTDAYVNGRSRRRMFAARTARLMIAWRGTAQPGRHSDLQQHAIDPIVDVVDLYLGRPASSVHVADLRALEPDRRGRSTFSAVSVMACSFSVRETKVRTTSDTSRCSIRVGRRLSAEPCTPAPWSAQPSSPYRRSAESVVEDSADHVPHGARTPLGKASVRPAHQVAAA